MVVRRGVEGYFGSVAVVQIYRYAKVRKYEPLEIRATLGNLHAVFRQNPL